MIGFGVNGVSRAVRRLRQRFSPAAVILLYHRVCEVETDAWDLSVSPEHFTEQLEVLRSKGFSLTLADLMARWQEGKRLPRRCFVVTFDDGYCDNLYNARPLLERFDVPATVFLVSGMLGSGEEFWWDVLDRVFLQPGTLPQQLSLTVDAATHRWDLRGDAAYTELMQSQHRGWRAEQDTPPGPRQEIYLSVWHLLFQLNDTQRRQLTRDILDWAGLDLVGRPGYAPLTAIEAQQLGSDDLIETGAHTRTHSSLSDLLPEAQAAEISDSKAQLETLFGRHIVSFSYPYGRFGPDTTSFVRRAGFVAACASQGGVARQGSDRFCLPRIHAKDWDGDAFTQALREYLPE